MRNLENSNKKKNTSRNNNNNKKTKPQNRWNKKEFMCKNILRKNIHTKKSRFRRKTSKINEKNAKKGFISCSTKNVERI
jgi:hypothetical protein